MDILSILLAILLFSSMILFHELGHFLTAKWAGVKVNEFSIGMGPKIVSFRKGETDYSLRLLPIGGFVAMEGEDEESTDAHCFTSVPVWKRIIITGAGAFVNVLYGFLIVVVLTFGQELLGEPVVAGFYENASSAKTLMVEDRILSVNDEKIRNDNDIMYALMRDNDGVVSMEVLRDGEKVRLEEVTFETRENERGFSSIVLDFSIYGVEPTFGSAFSYAFRWTWSLIRLVWHSLADLVGGNFSLHELTGPVGLTQTLSEAAAQSGGDKLFLIVALTTINLGIFNLLPLPALDGGRIFFMFIELIFKKPVNRNVEAAIHTVGMVALLALAAVVTFQDIFRLVTGG